MAKKICKVLSIVLIISGIVVTGFGVYNYYTDLQGTMLTVDEYQSTNDKNANTESTESSTDEVESVSDDESVSTKDDVDKGVSVNE